MWAWWSPILQTVTGAILLAALAYAWKLLRWGFREHLGKVVAIVNVIVEVSVPASMVLNGIAIYGAKTNSWRAAQWTVMGLLLLARAATIYLSALRQRSMRKVRPIPEREFVGVAYSQIPRESVFEIASTAIAAWAGLYFALVHRP